MNQGNQKIKVRVHLHALPLLCLLTPFSLDLLQAHQSARTLINNTT